MKKFIRKLIPVIFLGIGLISLNSCSYQHRPETRKSRTIKQNYHGNWKVRDKQGKDYYITLYSNGRAKSNWGHGEIGTWKLMGNKAVIVWKSGWKVMIYEEGKVFKKRAYPPGRDINGRPAHYSKAHKMDRLSYNYKTLPPPPTPPEHGKTPPPPHDWKDNPYPHCGKRCHK